MAGVLSRIVDAIRTPEPAVIASSAPRRLSDGIANPMTGLGSSVDGHAYARHFARRLTQHEIDQAYAGSQWMRKLIDLPAREQVRARRDWQADKQTIAKLEAEEKRLKLWDHVKRAEILRGLGGGAIVIWIDGDDPEQPLDPKRIRAGGISSLSVWSRWNFALGDRVFDLSSEWHGYPSTFEINGYNLITTAFGVQSSATLKFHPSRVVCFRGEQHGNQVGCNWQDEFWGTSKVEVALNAVLNCDAAQQSFASMIKDAVNVIIGIPGLTELGSLAAMQQFQNDRMTAVNTARSVWRAIVKDNGKGGTNAEGAETIEYRQMNWAGIPDVLMVFIYPVAAAGNMPATIMLGKSPDGMNATGKGDLDTWEREIDSRREVENRPCLEAIDVALVPSALGVVDDSVWWEYGALSTPSAKEQADTAYAKAQAIAIYATNGLLPTIALEKGVQNMLVEDRLMPGLDDALSEIPESERFPSLSAPAPELDADGNPIDPSAIQTEGGDPSLRAPGGEDGSQTARRRAANDALIAAGFGDADRTAILDALEVGEPADAPFADAFNAGQPRDDHGRWVGTGAWIARSVGNTEHQPARTIGGLSKRAWSKLNALGHSQQNGKLKRVVALDHSLTRHIMQRHGGTGEVKRGQIPVTARDIGKAHVILSRAHTVKVGNPATSKVGAARVQARTDIAGHRYFTVYEVRRSTIVPVSMYKRKIR